MKTLDHLGLCLDREKAEDLAFYDIRGKSPIADFMIIATGRSSTHIKALADKTIEESKKIGLKNIRSEGKAQGDWVLVDAGDIIVHFFRGEVRDFYELDKLWEDCIMDEQAEKLAKALV